MSELPFPNIDPIGFEIGLLVNRWYALALHTSPGYFWDGETACI